VNLHKQASEYSVFAHNQVEGTQVILNALFFKIIFDREISNIIAYHLFSELFPSF